MSSTNYASLSDMNNGTFTQDRSIDLSILSDNLVQGVELSKTLRPDMDPNALGGSINLILKTAQPGLHYNLSATGGYNNLRNSYNNYKFAGTVGDRFLDDKIGVLVQGTLEEKQLPSDQFNANYALQTSAAGASLPFYIQTTSATLQENNLKRQRYGGSVILDYASDLVDVKFFNVYDAKVDSNITRNYTNTFTSNGFTDNLFMSKTTTEQFTSSLQALFKFSGTELPVSISYTKGDQNRPNGMEFDFVENGQGAVSPIPPSLMIYGQPSTLVTTHGVMNPYLVNTTLWDMFSSSTDLTDESYDAKADWKVPFKISDLFSGKLSAGVKYHQVNRDSYNNRLWYNVQWGGSKGRRENLVNEFPFLTGANLNLEAGLPASYFVDPGYTRTSILGYPIGQGFDVYKMAYVMNTIFPAWKDAFYVDGPECYNQNYQDREKSMAGYVMGEVNVGNDLTLTLGARWQQEQTDIGAFHVPLNGSNQNGLGGVPTWWDTKRNNPDWYPSLNIKYKATENVQVMGAVYKSSTLPSYSDISPMVEYSSNQTITTGNPYLKPSTAWNLDLGTSVFSNEVGLFTVNIFYKDISNLIYSLQNYYPFAIYPFINTPSDIWTRLPRGSYFDTLWSQANQGSKISVSIPMNDPDDAYLRGIELSWQTHLWYLPWVLNGIVLDLNVSFMSSNQMYPSFKVQGPKVGNRDTLNYSTTEGTLQNQPKAIYNAIIGWDYLGFSARFSASYQQITLTSQDTRFGLQNYYYDNVLLIDISLKQQILGNLAVYANATNINEHIDNYYYSHPAYTTGTQSFPAGSLPTSGQSYGWDAQIGISYNY
jgi:TonB-dependent receptor